MFFLEDVGMDDLSVGIGIGVAVLVVILIVVIAVVIYRKRKKAAEQEQETPSGPRGYVTMKGKSNCISSEHDSRRDRISSKLLNKLFESCSVKCTFTTHVVSALLHNYAKVVWMDVGELTVYSV
jgi:predicted RND superfamily exporter protein